MRWLAYVLLIPMILGPATWWVVSALVSVFLIGLGLGGILL